MRSGCQTLVLIVPVSVLLFANLAAQGVTTAGMDGAVAGPDSAGIANAIVTVTNAADGERWQIVTLIPVGYDQANQRAIYFVEPADRKLRDDEATRWRMQLGARYTF